MRVVYNYLFIIIIIIVVVIIVKVVIIVMDRRFFYHFDHLVLRKKKVPLSKAIGKGELMHERFPKHSRMGAAKIK